MMEVEGRRSRGRLKMRWTDAITRDAREMDIDLDDALKGVSWKTKIQAGIPNDK